MIEPIYIYRMMTTQREAYLRAWAYENSIPNITEGMHVTLAYSTSPVNWDLPAFQMDPRPITADGGKRQLSVFGNALVLEFECRSFHQRWAQFVMAGASWDFPTYRPHVTLSYDAGDFDPESVTAPAIPLAFIGEYRDIIFDEMVA